MKTFKDYLQKGKNETDTFQESAQQASSVSTANAEELAQQIARAYNGTSNADMLKNILLEAEKGKRNGTLSNEEIENFYQTFSPMLDAQKRKRLRAIIDKLKQI